MNKPYLLAMLVLLAWTSHAQTFFVSVHGNDQHPGTVSQPFRSVYKAWQTARMSQGKQLRIVLREGTYYLDSTLVIRANELKNRSLELSAYGKERASISAGTRLQVSWKPFRNGIWQAELPSDFTFERLYINGVLQTLARYPNASPDGRVFQGTAADALSPERISRWKNPVGGYVHALHAGEWGGFHYRITGRKSNGALVWEGGWQNNRPAPLHKTHRMVENIFEELDAPGEWFRDGRMLYFFPPASVSLSTAIVEVSHLKNSIELRGTATQPIRNVTVQNLQFIHNERTFMDTKEPLVRSDWTFYRGGAILLENTEACHITGCTFTNLGGNGVVLSRYNRRSEVRGCHFAHLGASALAFVGDPDAVRSPLFRYEESNPIDQIDPTPGPRTSHYPKDCRAIDNLIHHIGEIEKQATGVQIEMAAGITVSHNTIYHTPRAGINIGDGCWGGHVISYNDVFDTVLETGDHGAFNSWGRDRFWYADRRRMDSLVAARPELILLDAQQPTLLQNNRFRCDHGWDIDLDDGSSNYRIINNVCLNGGLKLREGFYREVKNNILINNTFHPHVWFRNSGDVFEHNIVMRPYAPIQIKEWGKSVDYNIFTDTEALHNARQLGTDKNGVRMEAQFQRPEMGNYTLAANSKALASGFRNIPMNDFGVQSPALKKIAPSPDFPAILTPEAMTGKSSRIDFMGARMKNIEGLGERSAYGLPDESGIVLLDIQEKSILRKGGLQPGDVIRKVGGVSTHTIKELVDWYQANSWTGVMDLELIRNQQVQKLTIRLKE